LSPSYPEKRAETAARSCRRRRALRGRAGAYLLPILLVAGLFPSGAPGPLDGIAVRQATEAGLTWIFRKDASSELTCVLLLVRGGTGADPAGKAGLAYLGTRIAVDIPDEGKVRDIMVQSTRLSVTGLEDATMISVQCLSENLEDALKTVTRILRDPLISGLRIEAIKENMRHQAKTELDDSIRAGRAEAKRAFFGPDGGGGPVLGTEESLQAIRKKDVVGFYESRFRVSNMLLSVSSDLEEAVIASLFRKYFPGFRTGPRPEDRPLVPSIPAERRIALIKDAEQTYVGLHFPLPPLSARTYALAYLTEDLLGGGVGSRLWPLRSRDRLAYNVDSSLVLSAGGGLLSAYLETSPGKLDPARESIEAVIRELGAGNLSEEELEISRRSAAAAFLRANEMKEARARTALLFEARGLGFDYVETFPAELAAVGIDEMNAFLKSVLSMDRAVEVIIGPTE
jgi:zinc protease